MEAKSSLNTTIDPDLVVSGKSYGFLVNESNQINLVDYIEEKTTNILKKLHGGKWKKTNPLEHSFLCFARETYEELPVNICVEKIKSYDPVGSIFEYDEDYVGSLKIHRKDVYIARLKSGEWEIDEQERSIPPVYKLYFYDIDQAWLIIDKTHRPALAIALNYLFVEQPSLKQKYFFLIREIESELKKVYLKNQRFQKM